MQLYSAGLPALYPATRRRSPNFDYHRIILDDPIFPPASCRRNPHLSINHSTNAIAMADETPKVEVAQPASEPVAASETSVAATGPSTEEPTKTEPAQADVTMGESSDAVQVEGAETNNKQDESLEQAKVETAEADQKEESTKDEDKKNGTQKPHHRFSHKQHRDHRQNIKSDPTILPDTDDPVQIRAQVRTRPLMDSHRCIC